MAPILAPAAKRLGIDLVHFGIVIDVNMEVGLCHPPVGLNLYVASMIAGMRITDLAMAVMPWLLTMLVFLVIVTYWPGLTLCLPTVLPIHYPQFHRPLTIPTHIPPFKKFSPSSPTH